MKIAHVSPYDHQVAGGVREHVVNLARQQRLLGHQVKIIAPASSADGLAPDVICASTAVVAVPGSGSIARIAVSPAVLPRMARILRQEQFDVVHVHEPLLPMVSLAALFHSRAVTIGTIHGYRPAFFLYRYLRPVLERLMGRLSARTAVSVDARDWVSRYFPGEYHIISDGVDVARFADPDIRPVEQFDDGRLNVLFVGRLEPRKGFPYLLDAFGRVRDAVGDARLIVGGHYGDEARRYWTRVAAERGVTDVVFVGYVSDQDLPRFYRTADVFCAPSTGFEALGIVLLEAMAAGTPIVTTDIEGYRTVVHDGCEALVVRPADAAALARALVTLLRDHERRQRMAERGRLRAEAYAWPGIADRVMHLYRDAGAG
jgi:phosphatidyl-myo-inositol alpha-mannosyltransferase